MTYMAQITDVPNTVKSLYNAMFRIHRNGPCYEGIIL